MTVTISSAFAGTHVAVDVMAWVSTPTQTTSAYNPITPARILDTRASTRTGTCYNAGAPATCATFTAGMSREVQVTGTGGVPTAGVTAALVLAGAGGTTGSTSASFSGEAAAVPRFSTSAR